MDLVKEKKLLYVDAIMDIAKNNPNTEQKNEILQDLLERYYKYCYDNKVNSYDSDTYERGLGKLENYSYIIESEPEVFSVSTEKTMEAVEHLKQAQQDGTGITEEEAIILLDWSVQKARNYLAEDSIYGIKNDSLTGACGIAQMLTLVPFLEIGVKTTINNAYNFEKEVGKHAFGTVTLPIEKDGKVEDTQYLIDASYRQFFTTARCNYGRYYNLNRNSGPDPGYYVKDFQNGENIAKEILKKGYTKLTDDALKMYGGSFIASKLNIDTKNNTDYKNADVVFLRNVINNKQLELDYDDEEIKEYSKIVGFPSKNNKVKG